MPAAAKIALGAALLLGLLAGGVLRSDRPSDRGSDRGCRDGRPARSAPCPPAAAVRRRPARAVPLDARAFVNTIGVNTHLFYLDTSYGDYAMVKRRLLELGVRHIRDGLDPAHTRRFFDRVNDLRAAGIRSTLIACRVEAPGVPWTTYVKDAKRRVRSSLDALEGVNEPDLVAAGTAWSRSARICQGAVFRQAKHSSFGAPLRVPVLGPSVQAGNGELGRISDRADGAALHPYPGGGPPSGPEGHPLRSQMADARNNQFGGSRVPVYATETGYHDALNTMTDHPPVSQKAASIYLPRLFLEYARAGVRRTFAYELVDERPDPGLGDVELNYGLFESDWTYKPSAVALKNTIALLASRRKGPRRPLRYGLANIADPDGAGTGGAVRDLLLQKADGSYWLALWQDSTVWDQHARTDIANPSTPVRVTLDRRMALTSYHPTQGTSASGRRTARSFTADVGDDVLLIEMTRAR
ncbi:MAG: hypothetical protein M3296_07085 [Actinomycetota bacterium]|nr:hypothetical protein [Actinomycetota bacterium]